MAKIAAKKKTIVIEEEDTSQARIGGQTVTQTQDQREESRTVKTSILLHIKLKEESMLLAKLNGMSFTAYIEKALEELNKSCRESAMDKVKEYIQ